MVWHGKWCINELFISNQQNRKLIQHENEYQLLRSTHERQRDGEGWERKISNKINYDWNVSINRHSVTEPFRFQCTGKFMNANVHGMMVLACSCSTGACMVQHTQQEFPIESHFQIICALIMCRNHKIEAYYAPPLSSHTLCFSLCLDEWR